jgi:hypothetical protein
MSNVESTAETILGFVTAALKVASSVVPVIPGAAAPLKAAEVLVETADGALHRVTAMGVEAVATRETEAGRAANGRLAVVATDNLGIGVFLFHEAAGKMIHEHDIDCESVQVALESFRNWLQLKEVA